MMVSYLLSVRVERVIEILKGELSIKNIESKYIHKKGAQYGKIAN
ncbi:hypothetical protein BPADB04_37940 [Bacillus paranthracis]|nr:hypothetical protein BPADB04_37940 [Bacillus paranthracis]